MKRADGRFRLSATDVSNHMACRHLTALDLAVAAGRRKPPQWRRPDVLSLQERGLEHERAYLAHLERGGLRVVRLEEAEDAATSFERTVAEMRAGTDAIAQATLVGDGWFGRADVLLRVERPSGLGAWSYEVLDTKLARETRPGSILQICLYSDLLSAAQGAEPEFMHVVSPRPGFVPDTYRVRDFMAYYRLAKSRLEAAVRRWSDEGGALATYPEPVTHCEVCRWWPECDRRRRDDDHISFVADITRLQRRELAARDVETLAALAAQPAPLPWKPDRGSREGYERVGHQARVQLAGRETGAPVHELLPVEPGRGLSRLPEPSPGDLFLDLEGNPYAGAGGIEFLFGLASRDPGEEPVYAGLWATDAEEERRAFERAVDAITAAWARDPGLHVYHFAPYEPAAFKRLMGRYATREREIDALLRAGRFVDLHGVARQAMRASVERYSIKTLEPFFGFERAQPLEGARPVLRAAQAALEAGEAEALTPEIRAIVEAYNRDDCLSAMALRDWLEVLRTDLVAGAESVPRPVEAAGEASEPIRERERRVAELVEELTVGVPADAATRTEEQRALWLLAHLLDWHRREERAAWWEYFRLRELSDDDLLDERDAIAGLELVGPVEGTGRAVVHRYRYPQQETGVRLRDELHSRDANKVGEVAAINLSAGTVDIRKSRRTAEVHPGSVFKGGVVPSQVLAESLLRFGESVAANGLDAAGPGRAALDLLLRRCPRSWAPGPLRADGENAVQAARRLGLALDRGVFAVQGPPGSGKTFTGARMICDLVRAGKKVGVCAVSHKVVRNLLDAIVAAAAEERARVRCLQKVRETVEEEGEGGSRAVAEMADNAAVLAALSNGTADVVGGTAWLWARQEFGESVDALFVDEAGQMSLANVLAIAPAGKSLVLLGDPQQLDQPQQAGHPEGTDISALAHLLDGRRTVPEDRGLFLPETWRLHPRLCEFTSDLFYEGRLVAREGLERQALVGEPITGSGLWFLAVEHEGNRSASPEEVEQVVRLVGALIEGGTRWVNGDGETRPLLLEDILIVAPYNAQVADLKARLPGARVGTVDKFQGQEAPLVIYSMTSSSPEDAPRGMEFLYDLHRFNVATSRARAACVLVGSPRLFEPDCGTPEQMKLANAFCRYLELAQRLAGP